MQHNNIGILVIHGFGGGTFEIESLAKYFAERGYIVACPKLKGHTGNRKQMKRATCDDWIDSAEMELLKLIKKTSIVIIVGFSMGGLIAVNLAGKYKEYVKALVTVNTPIFFWNMKRVAINLTDDIRCKKCDNLKRYLKAKKSSPLVSMMQFLKILKISKEKFLDIEVPFLITQAMDDDTVKIKSVDYIYNNISSSVKEVKYYEKGGHLILESQYAWDVINDVDKFINKLFQEMEV